jgi:hypothetical protein
VVSQIQRAMLAMGIFAECHRDVMAGHSCFAWRPLELDKGSYGQNAENNRGGIFGMEVGLRIEVLLMNGARWVGLS